MPHVTFPKGLFRNIYIYLLDRQICHSKHLKYEKGFNYIFLKFLYNSQGPLNPMFKTCRKQMLHLQWNYCLDIVWAITKKF